MPTEIIITISDAGLPIVKAALDAENDFRLREQTRPQITMQQFLQEHTETQFGITADRIAAVERKCKLDSIFSKIDAMDAKHYDAVLVAIEAMKEKPAEVVP